MQLHKLFLMAGLLISSAAVVCVPEGTAAAQREIVLNEEEHAACQRIQQLWLQKYTDLNSHALVTEAMQTIADENRADFEVLLKHYGENVQDEAGNTARVIIMPTYFVVQ